MFKKAIQEKVSDAAMIGLGAIAEALLNLDGATYTLAEKVEGSLRFPCGIIEMNRF